MDDAMQQLKACGLFEHLSLDQILRLSTSSAASDFGPGRMIFTASEPSDAIFLLVSGRVRIFHILPDGKQILLAIVDSGEVFGELVLVGSLRHEDYAEAIEASRVIKMPRRILDELMDQNLGLAKKLAQLVGRRRIGCERRLKSLLFRSSRDRLVLLLLELAERYGQPDPRGVCIGVRFSHHDLATAIGSARETVTNILGRLQGTGLIEIDHRQIVLTDPDRLAAIPAGVSPEQHP